MIIIDYIIYFLFLVSIVLNVVLALKYSKYKKSKNSSDSYELSLFIRDLLEAEGLIKITRIAPSDIFLRSPRGR